MLSSVDGKIDGASLRAVTGAGEYEATGAKLNGDAWVCGRTTMQQHFAEDEPFVSVTNRPAGPQLVFVARRAESYAISVDTLGKLNWRGGDLDLVADALQHHPHETANRGIVLDDENGALSRRAYAHHGSAPDGARRVPIGSAFAK